ncbi:MAG: acylhydrolase [bacterium TMED46]|nr:MAG: acylhydrolase [bacterium TMED46]|tara:strand:- start:4254 stop:4892 length:639 start_codon:yes stop_codon:yes gene_type:complete
MEDSKSLDWANLARYEDDNLKVGLPKKDERSVVFMGDSITEEWSNLYPEYFTEKGYMNRGIGGQTTPQMLIRFKPDVIDLKPEIVVILAGTNDIAGNTGPSNAKMITDNIFSMAEIAKAYQVKVVLSSILPVYEYDWAREIKDPPSIIQAVNDALKQYAIDQGLIYLDYFSSMVDERQGLNSDYTFDGVHPNESGYILMSSLAEEVLSELLN